MGLRADSVTWHFGASGGFAGSNNAKQCVATLTRLRDLRPNGSRDRETRALAQS